MEDTAGGTSKNPRSVEGVESKTYCPAQAYNCNLKCCAEKRKSLPCACDRFVPLHDMLGGGNGASRRVTTFGAFKAVATATVSMLVVPPFFTFHLNFFCVPNAGLYPAGLSAMLACGCACTNVSRGVCLVARPGL